MTDTLSPAQALEACRAARREQQTLLDIRAKVHAYAEEIIGLGSWTWDPDTDKTVYSDNMFRLFGMTPGEITPVFDTAASYAFADHRPRFLNRARTLRSHGEHAIEYRVRLKDGRDRLFAERTRMVRRDGGARMLIGITEDITERTRSETEKFKILTLLEKSEELTESGSWDFDLGTSEFTWSDGMYRLFELEKGTPVQPEVYLEHATPEGLPAARRVVSLLRAGTQDFEETVEINAGGRAKTLRLKATVLHDARDEALEVLGVDVDATSMLRAEEDKRRLLQEKVDLEERLHTELLAATLNTQESERRRIAESLHNGMGQMLYGVQLNLEQLDLRPGQAWEARHAEQRCATQRLLSAAIVETRRISHELMPAVLEDFGLKAALEDMCRQLSHSLDFSCEFGDLPERMEQYLEIALYRSVQELVTNALRHGRATRISVRLRHADGAYHLEVRDNGAGFDVRTANDGIGLKTIRDKVALLKGEFRVDSGAHGATVTIRLPDRTG